MSDAELIARLRGACYLAFDDWCLSTAPEAAARIEALTAKLATCEKYRDAYAECDRIGTQTVRDLEVKLEKAVAALDAAVNWADRYRWAAPWVDNAIATLAEIKGESQDGMV